MDAFDSLTSLFASFALTGWEVIGSFVVCASPFEGEEGLREYENLRLRRSLCLPYFGMTSGYARTSCQRRRS